MVGMDKSVVKNYLRIYEALKADRGSHEDEWREIASNIYPYKTRLFNDSPKPDFRKIYDGTPMWSLGMLTAFLHTMLTNPAQIWCEVAPDDDKLEKRWDVRKWMQETNLIMYKHMVRSNLHCQLHEGYADLCAFGNMPFWTEASNTNVMRYRSLPLTEVLWDVNDDDVPDTAIRMLYPTVRWIAQQFGKENLSAAMLKSLEKPESMYVDRFRIIQIVRPRESFSSLPMWHKLNRKYESVWISVDDQHCIDVGGYYDNPLAVCRFDVCSGERIGHGPGSLALPDARQLHMLQKHTLRAAQKMTDPALMLPDRAFVGPIDLSSSALNYYRKSGAAGMKGGAALVQPFPQGQHMADVRAEKQDMREMVQRDFFVDQLRIREGDRMTKEEVIHRAEENNRIFSPVQGRSSVELTGPIGRRTFDALRRQGRIPPPPADVLKGGLRIRINNPLQKQQAIADIQGLVSAMDMVTPMANAKPEILNAINESKFLEFVFKSFGAPLEVLHDPREFMAALKQKQESDVQQQQMLAGSQSAAAMAGAVKDIAAAQESSGGGLARMPAIMQ